jgi:small GTP-binding protein
MLQKKVCMLGGFAVGKTSLVARCVQGVFSDRYLSTVGVKIDRHETTTDAGPMSLVLWDLAGQDAFQSVRMSYLRGASGFVYVVDPTRPETADVALDLLDKARSAVGDVPSLLLLNKADLEPEWALTEGLRAGIEAAGWLPLKTSAKTGHNVAAAFQELARRMAGGGA